jgi:hypothetical protein
MKFFLFLILFLFCVKNIYASSGVVINEFSIDATSQSVELLNISTAPVNISHWYIDDNGGNSFYTIPDNSVLFPSSCIVFTGDFNLNKSSSDSVRLFDSTSPPTTSSAQLVDSYTYSTGPAANMSYGRSPDGTGSWTTQVNSIGKYNANGLPCTAFPTSTPAPTSVPTVVPTSIPPSLTPTPIQIQNVFISEAFVYPETGQNEWVEVFNNNTFQVSLNNWYIDDGENTGGSPQKFSITIPADSYGTIQLSSSLFNNDADEVRLLNENKGEIDKIDYGYAEKGKSIGKIDPTLSLTCVQEASPDSPNSSCTLLSPSPASLTSTPSVSLSFLTPTTFKPTPKTTRDSPHYVQYPFLSASSKNTGETISDIPSDRDEESTFPSNEIVLKESSLAPYIQSTSVVAFVLSLITVVYIGWKIATIHAQ